MYIKIGVKVLKSKVSARIELCAKTKVWGFEIAYFSYTTRWHSCKETAVQA